MDLAITTASMAKNQAALCYTVRTGFLLKNPERLTTMAILFVLSKRFKR